MILLFGHTGSLGLELTKQLENKNIFYIKGERSIVTASQLEIDLYIKKINPNIIINCAAMTGLDACYANRKQAFLINTCFPKKLSLAIDERKIRIIHFSTDNVFACNNENYVYSEEDIPNVNTVYGETKLLGESYIITGGRNSIIRLPMLYGPTHNGQVIEKLMRMYFERTPFRVSSDVFTTPVYTPHLVHKILSFLDLDNDCKIHLIHGTSNQILSLHEFMQKIVSNFDKNFVVKSVLSSEFKTLENKPKYAGLTSIYDNMKLDLIEGINDYSKYLKELHK
jgi:dTDP-4-dehydrorhamnose reductase